MSNGMFSADQYAATRLPLHRASSLPGWCYVSPEWYAREVETMFRKDWLCVGRVEQIANPGDFYSFEIIGQPLIVCRDESAQVRVHSAVCRHRGAVVTQGSGTCRAFVCPYHSWTYGLDGRLRGTPGSPAPMASAEGFSAADYGLTPIRSETWGGFIFITFNDHTEPLTKWLDELPAFLDGSRLEGMQWKHRDVYDLECNWKVWVENAMENYHSWTVHRKHMGPVRKGYSWVYAKARGPWEAMTSKSSLAARTSMPGKEIADEESHHIWLQPNLKIIYNSSVMKFRLHLPNGPEKLRVLENWAFPRQSAEAAQAGEIADTDYYKKYSEIIEEDIASNTNVQKGLRSGAYRPGRYSEHEDIVHRIANRVLDCVVGKDDAKSRALRHGADTTAKEAV